MLCLHIDVRRFLGWASGAAHRLGRGFSDFQCIILSEYTGLVDSELPKIIGIFNLIYRCNRLFYGGRFSDNKAFR